MIRNVKVIFNKDGISIIELLISLSLFLIFLFMAFRFYSYVKNTFIRGESQFIVQENVAKAAHFITEELRNATDLSLEDSYIDVPGYCSIFIEDSILKYKDSSGVVTNKTDAVISQFSIDLVEIEEKYKIVFSLEGTHNSLKYDISTETILNNLRNATPSSGKSVIIYKKP